MSFYCRPHKVVFQFRDDFARFASIWSNFEIFPGASQIQSGDLKMAAGRDDSVLDIYSRNIENNVEIRFVGGGKLRAVCIEAYVLHQCEGG